MIVRAGSLLDESHYVGLRVRCRNREGRAPHLRQIGLSEETHRQPDARDHCRAIFFGR